MSGRWRRRGEEVCADGEARPEEGFVRKKFNLFVLGHRDVSDLLFAAEINVAADLDIVVALCIRSTFLQIKLGAVEQQRRRCFELALHTERVVSLPVGDAPGVARGRDQLARPRGRLVDEMEWWVVGADAQVCRTIRHVAIATAPLVICGRAFDGIAPRRWHRRRRWCLFWRWRWRGLRLVNGSHGAKADDKPPRQQRPEISARHAARHHRAARGEALDPDRLPLLQARGSAPRRAGPTSLAKVGKSTAP